MKRVCRAIHRLRGFARRPQPPLPTPFSLEYAALHRAFVTNALASPRLIKRFAHSRKLPRGFGVGLDERVVEYPWLLAQWPGGKVLDAGSTLNHAHVLDVFLPITTSLDIVTLAPEPVAYPERGISYVYADLRNLPFPDAHFDTITSISTLEHVGMDNSRYGAEGSIEEEVGRALLDAVVELRRVLRPGGLLLLSVPYGAAENLGWLNQFDHDAIENLVEAIAPRSVEITVYAYSRRGWQRSSLAETTQARYRDSTIEKQRPHDLAVAARAVACLRATC